LQNTDTLLAGNAILVHSAIIGLLPSTICVKTKPIITEHKP